jgi:N6-L-threonylcarbamoyladenine synthase
MQMKILAIETSCDETAIAVVACTGGAKAPRFEILSNIVASQIAIHAPFGGVVPNLAKREHEKNLPIVLLQALQEAGVLIPNPASPAGGSKFQIPKSISGIDAIAVTIGPGLAPALWTGVNFAKELAEQWKKSIIPVNHMEGHIASVLLTPPNPPDGHRGGRKGWFTTPIRVGRKVVFPALALLVSGGHTELVLMKNWKNKRVIGETLDDAAGEAFDKVGRLLGLGYPGGPAIAREAEKNFQIPISNFQTNSKSCLAGRRVQIQNSQIKLPRPMLHTKDYNFSFSGLKTAVRYLVENLKQQDISVKKLRPAIAKEFQDAVVEVLVKKTIRAAKEYRVKTVILGGGVAANNLLRARLTESVKKELPFAICYLPSVAFTGDNAAMIAAAAYLASLASRRAAYLNPKKIAWTKLHAIDRLSL